MRAAFGLYSAQGSWTPRHPGDAAYPSAVERQELENHGRPAWLPDELKMPSVRVWSLLREGSAELAPAAAFQAVMTGLVNAGWPEVCIKYAFKDNATHPGAPGHWWLRKRHGRQGEFDRAYVNAVERVRANPSDPRLAKHPNAENRAVVADLLTKVERQLLDLSSRCGAHLFPADRNRPFPRAVVFAFVQHAREHAGLLEVDELDGSLLVAASARCLAGRLNCSHQAVSDVLRSLSRDNGPSEAAYTALLTLATAGRPDDAHTYRLDARRIDRSRAGQPSEADPSLPQSSRETYGKEGSEQGRLLPPTLDVVAHDAFQTVEGAKGLTRTQGFLVACIDSNPGMLRPRDLAMVSGLTDRAVRVALQPLLVPTDQRTALLKRERTGPYALGASGHDELLVELDQVGLASGVAGSGRRRQQSFEDERMTWRLGA